MLGGLHAGSAGLPHAPRPLEQAGNVHASGRGGNETEIRERRITPAYVRRVEKDSAEAALARELLERRAGIGDARESFARRFPTAERRRRFLKEIVGERARLESRAGFARFDE